MSQNVKQSSLQLRRLSTPPSFVGLGQLRRLSTPPSFVGLGHCCSCRWCVCCFVLVSATVCVCLGVCETELFHLASNGCNRWEMEIVGVLHMLWMHVDGSPWPS